MPDRRYMGWDARHKWMKDNNMSIKLGHQAQMVEAKMSCMWSLWLGTKNCRKVAITLESNSPTTLSELVAAARESAGSPEGQWVGREVAMEQVMKDWEVTNLAHYYTAQHRQPCMHA